MDEMPQVGLPPAFIVRFIIAFEIYWCEIAVIILVFPDPAIAEAFVILVESV